MVLGSTAVRVLVRVQYSGTPSPFAALWTLLVLVCCNELRCKRHWASYAVVKVPHGACEYCIDLR